MKQKTLKEKISFEGIGVHLGQPGKIVLHPAKENTGIVFYNNQDPSHKIVLGEVIPEDAMHASVLKKSNFIISTIEHLMAAISSFSIDNISVEMNCIEVPILDGSSLPFVYAIDRAGVVEQDAKKYYLTPRKEIVFKDDKDGRLIKISPAEQIGSDYIKKLYFDYVADFKHPLIGIDKIGGLFSLDFFKKQIAPARTFGYLEHLPFLRRNGLAQGTSLGNTVVVSSDGFLNERRFENEFTRHKFLDLVGDLALLGKNIVGKIYAEKTGHNFNRRVVEHYIKNPNDWMLI